MGGSSRQSEDINDITTDNSTYQDHINSDNLQGVAREAHLSKSSIGDVSTTSNSNNVTNANTYNTTTDYGAIDAAGNVVVEAFKTSEDLAEMGILSGENIASDSIDAVIRATDNSAEVSGMALDFARDSSESFADDSLELSKDFASNTNSVFETGTKAVYAAGEAAINAARDAAGEVAAAYSGANRSILDVSDRAVNEVSYAYGNATKTAFDSNQRITEQSLAGWQELFNTSNNRIDNAIDQTLDFVANNNANTLGAIVSSTKSEGERTNDTMIKVAVGGALLTVGIMAWRS